MELLLLLSFWLLMKDLGLVPVQSRSTAEILRMLMDGQRACWLLPVKNMSVLFTSGLAHCEGENVISCCRWRCFSTTTGANSRCKQILTNLAAKEVSFWVNREPESTAPKYPEAREMFCLPCALPMC